MARLTHHDTLALQDVVAIGDLVLLPHESDVPIEEVRALMVAGVIPPQESFLYRSVFELMSIAEKYKSERFDEREPAWIDDYPPNVRTYCRLVYAQTDFDVFTVVCKLGHTGVSYLIKSDGLAQNACETFNLYRLSDIKQLGFLNAPPYNDNLVMQRQSISDHSRFTHSLDVYAVGSLIASNLGLIGSSMNTVQTLLIAHDALSPAGGDSVKDIDPIGLDEDSNFGWLLEQRRDQFVDYAKKYHVDAEVLKTAMLGQGLFGQVLDVADKIAYVARDLMACRHHLESGVAHDQFGARSLLMHMERYPYVCSIWDSVVEQYGQIAFDDPVRLAAFLKVRLLLFRELYYHRTRDSVNS